MKIRSKNEKSKIDLGDYEIVGDPNCWILYKSTDGSKNPLGYFSNISTLLKSLARRELKLSGSRSFKELISNTKRIEAKINEIAEEIEIGVEGKC